MTKTICIHAHSQGIQLNPLFKMFLKRNVHTHMKIICSTEVGKAYWYFHPEKVGLALC